MNKAGYDIIGDIHGYAEPLKKLLEKMEYKKEAGCYRHPVRKVIFLGDFIDRGQQQKEVLETVMPMVQNGAALAVMGNHEFNALAFHTLVEGTENQWLRPHSDKNIRQHQAFLDTYPGNDENGELNAVLEFFGTLPLWLDLDGLRVVHAVWDPRMIDTVKQATGGSACLTKALLAEASTKDSPLYDAVETLLKGMEFSLTGGKSFKDKDGNKRTDVRVWFHHNQPKTLGEVLVNKHIYPEDFYDLALDDDFRSNYQGYGKHEPPVFVGHYWMAAGENQHPARLADNVACLDYSVAKDGMLVAYRWSGEQVLDDAKFIF